MDRPVSVSADAKSYNIGIGSEVQKAGSGHPYWVVAVAAAAAGLSRVGGWVVAAVAAAVAGLSLVEGCCCWVE